MADFKAWVSEDSDGRVVTLPLDGGGSVSLAPGRSVSFDGPFSAFLTREP